MNTLSSITQQVLGDVQARRSAVQEFCPLAETLEWRLGQQYFRERGTKAFTSDSMPVPFVINNDGSLSRRAAEVFFSACESQERGKALDSPMFVLELGIGLGLFARFFLDAIRDLCVERKRNYYDRLTYVCGDISERMLLDVMRHGVLANHAGKVKMRVVDAMAPQLLASDLLFRGHGPKPFRAVFLNYVLDCLPVASLEMHGDAMKQLYVRTCVARGVDLKQHTDLTVEQLQERAKSSDPAAHQELLDVYGLFASEYDYRPVKAEELPYGAFAFDYCRRTTKKLLHNYGAIQSLDELLKLTAEDGVILINDYGQTQPSREDEFEHQRFSLATAVGLNFPLLRTYFSEVNKKRWIEPAGDSRGIHSRLVGHKLDAETISTFFEQFDDKNDAILQEPIARARLSLRAGRFELAASYYREAVKLQPNNWVLLGEVSQFLTFQMRDPKAGGDMAKLALSLNPTCSAELWNTLGDALYEGGRTQEAKSVYRKALSLNSHDVRARHSLAWVHTRERDYPAALEMIAEALSHDRTGQFRDQLLQKQQEVLALAAVKNQQEYLLLTNLVSKYSAGDKPEEKPPPLPQHSN